MKTVNIYTDGACRGNPGAGGWGAVLVYGEVEKRISGGDAQTTNNKMELTAVIEAFKMLKYPCKVILCSDSKYVIDGLKLGWAKSWRQKGWKKGDGKPALNPELWAELLDLVEVHRVEYVWIKGHAGHKYNEICDEMATAEADKYKQ